MSLDGLKSTIYEIANRYVMAVRHQTVVTYTSKLPSDGPIGINTVPKRLK